MGMTDKQFLAYVRGILRDVHGIRKKLDDKEDKALPKARRKQAKCDAKAALANLEADLQHTVSSLEED